MEPLSKQKLCSRMRLWEFPDQYVVEPIEGGNGFLSISRANGTINLIGEVPISCSGQSPKTRTIFGLAGSVKFSTGIYVPIITARECAGSYRGYPIYKIKSMNFLKCNSSSQLSSGEKIDVDISKLLRAAENTPGLYFSYDVDLTLSAQRFHSLKTELKTAPLWKQADARYLWNKSMTGDFIEQKLDAYVLPIIQGSFQTIQSVIGKATLNVTLIARRCMKRTGTRMWRRGADLDGNVANFVETEQILESKGYLASYILVRGSIPLLWEQVVDLTYKPSFKFVNLEETPKVVHRHFTDLKERYGSVVAVDLINQRGGEGLLSQAFSNSMKTIVDLDIKYLQFDFHKICGHAHFERLSLLYDQLEDEIKRHRYFLVSASTEKIEEQSGVIRVNCIDCLDRTNVTQSMLGRKALEAQLREINILGGDETINKHLNFDNLFKILWANHGDDISIQYSGTPALKGDFVRYGQRTYQGVIDDGWSALSRYYYNNFCDGEKQDAIDLLLGNYNTSQDRGLSLQTKGQRMETLTSLPLASIFVLGGMMLAAFSLRQGKQGSWRFFFSAFWVSLTVGIMTFVKINGRLFCNRPRLR